MVRTQIQLTEDQARSLKRLAIQRDASMASLIREAVDRLLSDDRHEDAWARAFSVVGKYRSGVGDVAVEHDRELDEAFSS